MTEAEARALSGSALLKEFLRAHDGGWRPHHGWQAIVAEVDRRFPPEHLVTMKTIEFNSPVITGDR